ncbi:MAG TPA: hypothetical protein VIG99_20910 [Myxococcaceae bacterium]|jgi:hypothetical protein
MRIADALDRFVAGFNDNSLDEAGLITGKYTYANYTRRRIRRELGGP